MIVSYCIMFTTLLNGFEWIFVFFLRDVWQPRKKMPNSDTWTSFWGATSIRSYEKSQFLMGI